MGKKSFAPANGDSETTLPADDIEYNAATNKQKNKGDDVKLSDLSSSSSSEKSYPAPFAGMGREMVLHYSDTPGWNRARKILLIIFWGSWFVLLGAVIYLTVTHPRCKLPPVRDWLQTSSVYQVYPRSFKDTNSDGVGDLKGIEEKLDYLKDINVNAIWISPFYESPMLDFGYDVSDYRAIDPVFGSMGDFDSLLNKMHEHGMKLIIDFIPNHTSDKHEWFIKSVNKEKPYDNYYIWSDCGNNGDTPPNNWISVVGGSAWKYNPTRDQCFFHQYQESMPDLNIRNNRVKQELDAILKFWLDKGVDGIRVDAIIRLYEDYNLEDEPVSGKTSNQNDYDYLNHTKTFNQPEIMDMVNRWRGIADSYSEQRLVITEAYASPSDLRMYYGRTENGGAHFPFNFQLVQVDAQCGARCVSELVNDWMANKPENATANWVLGNHDRSRMTSRVGSQKLDAMNMLLTLLPGVSTTYYGDEIGMEDIDISNRESQDPVGKVDKSKSRDPERSPMQWTPGVASCAGFTSNCSAAWLPIHPNANNTNVASEMTDYASHLNVYTNLTSLRKENTFRQGDWKQHTVTDNVYSFTRFYDGMKTYLVVVNIGATEETVDLSPGTPAGIKPTVAAITGNADFTREASLDGLSEVKLKPGDGVVLSWPYQIKELMP